MVARRDDRQHLSSRNPPARSRISAARLEALIEEAIVDAYTEAEQVVGFHATIEQHLALPFETIVLGVNVTVRRSTSQPRATSSRSATVGVSGRPFRFSTCRCRLRRRLAGSGSKPIADGPGDEGRRSRGR